MSVVYESHSTVLSHRQNYFKPEILNVTQSPVMQRQNRQGSVLSVRFGGRRISLHLQDFLICVTGPAVI